MTTKKKTTASGKLAKPSELNDLGSMRRVRDRAHCNTDRDPVKNRVLIDCMTRAISILEEEIFTAKRKAG